MNVIINVLSQLNILFTLDELMVVIRVEKKPLYCMSVHLCIGEKNYMANYLLRHQEILGAVDGINSTPLYNNGLFQVGKHLIQPCSCKYVFNNIT